MEFWCTAVLPLYIWTFRPDGIVELELELFIILLEEENWDDNELELDLLLEIALDDFEDRELELLNTEELEELVRSILYSAVEKALGNVPLKAQAIIIIELLIVIGPVYWIALGPQGASILLVTYLIVSYEYFGIIETTWVVLYVPGSTLK